jgi:hypothetical protein
MTIEGHNGDDGQGAKGDPSLHQGQRRGFLDHYLDK